MKSDSSLAQLAAQCEQRAKEVKSVGDRAQLLQIARQLRELAKDPRRRRFRVVEIEEVLLH
jgi:hypothetical protein